MKKPTRFFLFLLIALPGILIAQNRNLNIATSVPVANFSAEFDSICSSFFSENFTNLSTNNPTSWKWYFPGATPDTSTLKNPTGIVYSGYGCYTVKLVATNSSGSDSLTDSNYICLDEPPHIIFSGASQLCEGSSTTICVTGGNQYIWSTGQRTSCVNVLPPASINYTVQVRNGACVKDTFFYVEVVPLPTAKINPASGGICDTGLTGIQSVNDTVVFTLSDTNSGNTYQWSPSYHISCITCPNPKVYPYENTVYTLTVTRADGCQTVYYDTITVGNIQAKITGQDSVCSGGADTLTVSGGSSIPTTIYGWSNGETTSSIIVNPSVPTTYSVFILSGMGGCTASAGFNVGISNCTLGIPEISAQPEISIFPNPTNSILTITMEKPISETSTLSITDITGRILLTKKITSSQSQINIDVSTLAPAVYFLKIQTNQGIVVKKFVKD